MPAGTVVASGSLVSPGGQQGIPGPNAVSTDAGNVATFGSDSRIYVPDPAPEITSMRLRSFNAIGNPSFEVDQRNVGATVGYVAGPMSGFQCDRWNISKNPATGTFNGQKVTTATPSIVVPGTNYYITNSALSLNVVATQASLAAGEYALIQQLVEGPQLRELLGDVHSLSVLAYSSVPLHFTIGLRVVGGGYSLNKLCTHPGGGVYTLFTFPNLPVWASGGTWDTRPGIQGYYFHVCLGAGATFTGPADTWQSATYYAATGTDNWLANSGAVFRLAFVQHEPGSVCTTLQDKPFSQNLDECLRYYQKSYAQSTAVATVTQIGAAAIYTAFSSTSIPIGKYSFKKMMAKAPTLTGYSPATGAANNLRNYTSVADVSVTSFLNPNEDGYAGINVSSAPTAGSNLQWHHVADTGW